MSGKTYADKIAVFDEIRVKPGSISGTGARGTVSIIQGNSRKDFEVIYRYSEQVELNQNLAGLLMAIPAINFSLFAKKFVLDFPVSQNDLQHLKKFITINNTEVFVNKIARRRYEFFRKDFLPSNDDITADNAVGITEVIGTDVFQEVPAGPSKDNRSVAVLSSGGKESLLSYGLLRESSATTHAFYFNESGSHWFTASTAYRYYEDNFTNVHKVWSNVDRLYRFFLRNLELIDQDAIKRKTDTYPVQLFIFPVYIMALVPLARKVGITSVVLGDEFDDPREMTDFMGIRHYYGVYDQTHDFNELMSIYLSTKLGYFMVWSAVYPVSGSVVEKILVSRYPELYRLQRSCHSCRSVGGEMVPCGRCSKCLGIMMFTLAAGGDPRLINYREDSIKNLAEMVEKERMRLDSDELNLMKRRLGFVNGSEEPLLHVDGIHLLPGENTPFEKVPETFRTEIANLVSPYSNGIFRLEGNLWEKT